MIPFLLKYITYICIFVCIYVWVCVYIHIYSDVKYTPIHLYLSHVEGPSVPDPVWVPCRLHCHRHFRLCVLGPLHLNVGVHQALLLSSKNTSK